MRRQPKSLSRLLVALSRVPHTSAKVAGFKPLDLFPTFGFEFIGVFSLVSSQDNSVHRIVAVFNCPRSDAVGNV